MNHSIREQILQAVTVLLAPVAALQGAQVLRSPTTGVTREQSPALLIFPEGKSHNEAGLEPLKTGLARVALQARDEHGITRLRILPLGLVFEDKATPGTAVCARVGSVIEMDLWRGSDHTILTQEIAKRLRAVSEDAGSPRKEFGQAKASSNTLRERAIALAAWWGRLTHQLPVRIARNMAVKHSTDAGEPAMFTILFGIGLVLLTYVVHLTVVGMVVHSVLFDCLYLAGLLSGDDLYDALPMISASLDSVLGWAAALRKLNAKATANKRRNVTNICRIL